jgi:hypothetical protein
MAASTSVASASTGSTGEASPASAPAVGAEQQRGDARDGVHAHLGHDGEQRRHRRRAAA